MADNPHANHRRRLKDRFLKTGLDSFEEHNALELLLFFGIPQKDTNDTAHYLIDRFGSLNQVLEAPYEELIKVNGIGENAACLIKLMLPLARYYSQHTALTKNHCDTPDAAGEYLMGCYAGINDERVSILCMDDQCHPLSFDFVSDGDAISVTVRFRDLVSIALSNNATSIILCHNHPGGVALPSKQDIVATQKAVESLRTVGIHLVDHIILARDDFVSLAQSEKYSILFK